MDDNTKLEWACDLASVIWRRQASALQLIVLREKGAEELVRYKQAMLGSHQQKHYVGGLKKLGIENGPPAVTAAKYHYLSNMIGGSSVEYIEETEKKVWIRYVNEDLWADGSALIVVPASSQRATFKTWHAHNAAFMGSSRLGYVCTKVRQDGEPYNEGYFIEYDEDISPEMAIRFTAVTSSPQFDPNKAPKLDPELWPQRRISLARRKYGGAYFYSHLRALWNSYGLNDAAHLTRQAMSILAVQNQRQLAERFGVEQQGFKGAVDILSSLLSITGEQYEIVKKSPQMIEIHLHKYVPFPEDLPPSLRDALFCFPSMLVRMMGGTIKMTREQRSDGVGEVWTLCDTNTWLY